MMERVQGVSRDGWIAAGCAAGIHLGLALVAILAGITGASEWFDQRDYHLPVILEFARTLPTPDLSDYNSATTPGYHLLMAVAVRAGAEGGGVERRELTVELTEHPNGVTAHDG